jgi:hypothetical protein
MVSFEMLSFFSFFSTLPPYSRRWHDKKTAHYRTDRLTFGTTPKERPVENGSRARSTTKTVSMGLG